MRNLASRYDRQMIIAAPVIKRPTRLSVRGALALLICTAMLKGVPRIIAGTAGVVQRVAGNVEASSLGGLIRAFPP